MVQLPSVAPSNQLLSRAGETSNITKGGCRTFLMFQVGPCGVRTPQRNPRPMYVTNFGPVKRDGRNSFKSIGEQEKSPNCGNRRHWGMKNWGVTVIRRNVSSTVKLVFSMTVR